MNQHQMCLLPVATESERVLLNRLGEARREVAALRSQLAAMADREQAQEAVIRGLRHDLLEANDIAGRAEDAAPKSVASEFSYKWMAVTKNGRFIGG